MKRISFFGFDTSVFNNNIFMSGPYALLKEHLKKHGYDINTEDLCPAENCDFFIFCRLPSEAVIKDLIALKKMQRSIYIQYEPEVVVPMHKPSIMRKIKHLFGAVLTWDERLIDDVDFFALRYLIRTISTYPSPVAFQERKLLTNISGNKEYQHPWELYSQRKKGIRFMEQNHPDDFDFYGTNWNLTEYPSYCGVIPDKKAVLERYRFSICFENMKNVPGYITEKIFDCFNANTVPIYWGCSNIDEYIPQNCFIDFRSFSSWKKLYQFISTMSEDTFNTYLDAKNEYVQSTQYAPFLPENFAENIKITLQKLEQRKIHSQESVEDAYNKYQQHQLWNEFWNRQIQKVKALLKTRI